MIRDLRASLALAATAVPVCVTLRHLFSLDQVPVFRDLLLFIVPIKQFLGEHLRRGEIPLWNPSICLGSPFLAAMHMGAFYPPSVLLLVPLPLGFNLFLLVHYLIALIGMWKFLSERALGSASAAVGSLAFTIGGYAISLLNITKELHGLAWLPWVLLLWARWLRRGSRRDLLLTAMPLALQILGGSVETMLMTVALLAALALHAKAPNGLDMVRAAIGLGIVVGVAAALSAFQLLPTLEYGLQSGRAGALSEAQVFHWSLQPVSLLQLLLPISAALRGDLPALGVGLEPYPPMLESVYLGVPVFCLAFAGVLAGRDGRFWGLLLGASLVAALGSSTPLLPFLYQSAPSLFGRLRYPEKFFLLAHVSVAVLAAEGMARLELERSAARIAAIVAAGVSLAVAITVWWIAHHQPRAYLDGLSWMGARSPTAVVPVAEEIAAAASRLFVLGVSMIAVLAMTYRRWIEIRAACVALVLLEAGDLATIHWRSLATTSWAEVQATVPLVNVDQLREKGQSVFHYTDVQPQASDPSGFQLASWPMSTGDWVAQYRALWSTLFGNVGMVYGVASLGGADGFQRRDVKTLLDVLPTLPLDGVARLLGRLGVAYLIGPSPRESPLLELAVSGHEVTPFVYRITDAVPFARLVERLHVEPSEAAAFVRLAGDDFDPRREAIVEELPAGWTGAGGSPGTADRVTLVSRESDRIDLRVVATQERLLVINESAYPGWSVTVDGEPSGIVRANGLVRGVRVPAGEHAVTFRFRPSGFRLGCILAVVAASGVAILLLRRGPSLPLHHPIDERAPDGSPSMRARSTVD